MILDSVALRHFRSHKKLNLTFSPGINLIVGPNGIGKTNLLEALYLTGVGRSFRAERERDMIDWGEEVSRVTCSLAVADRPVSDDPERTGLEIVLTHGMVNGRQVPTKKYLVNGVARRQIDFVGTLRVVLFWPQDIELVTGSPSGRRRYLDQVLVQTDREYRRCLTSYERGLRQRNKILAAICEGKAGRSQLVFWNELLIQAGTYITTCRQKLLDFVNAFTPEAAIQQAAVSYQVHYDKSIISEERLLQYKEEEVAAKSTLVGPHRDDVIINVKWQSSNVKNPDGIPLAAFGSRGEQRLGVLWLKLAEVAYITRTCGDRPLLLLDDIFSEFDHEHRALVWDLVNHHQAIITSAEDHVSELGPEAQKRAKISHLPLP